MKTCRRCHVAKDLAEFCTMTKAADGRHPWCRTCRSTYNLAWVRAKPGYAIANIKRMRALYPERQRARSKIAQDVKMGRRPSARKLTCTDCPAPAASYDHARGYLPPDDLYVEPVCHRCHGLRSRARGEHRVQHQETR